MRGIQVLGASGSKGANLNPSSFLISKSACIDAGNITKTMKDNILDINHIFISHSHLDHILDIPFIVDNTFQQRAETLNIYALECTIESMKLNIFNKNIWPEFHMLQLINTDAKAITFHCIKEGEIIEIDDVKIEGVMVNHTIDTLGFVVTHEDGSIFYTADTHKCDKIWDTINTSGDIHKVIIDVSFPDSLESLGEISRHFTPKVLAGEMKKLKRKNVIFLFAHIKPNLNQAIKNDLDNCGILSNTKNKILNDGAFIPFDNTHFNLNDSHYGDNRVLDTLLSYVPKILEIKDLDKLLVLISMMAKELVDADRCSIWMIDKENKKIWTKVAHGIDRIEMPMHKGIVGSVALSGKVELINKPYDDPRFNSDIDKATHYKTESLLCVPIYNSDNQIVAIYQAINKYSDNGKFNKDDIQYLNIATIYTGNILESLMLRENLDNTQKEIIFLLTQVCESRSGEVGNHIRRVAEYSCIIAKALQISQKLIESIRIASTMHDIGKVGIPDAILNKPGKLDEAEMTIMKTHVDIGVKMLSGSNREMIKLASVMIQDHHEKWDGSGYPKGKSGDDISVYGQMVALADVFDALTSKRVYKKAWSLAEAKKHILSSSGTHFSPKIVEIFSENFEEFQKIHKQYKD